MSASFRAVPLPRTFVHKCIFFFIFVPPKTLLVFAAVQGLYDVFASEPDLSRTGIHLQALLIPVIICIQ